jgi:hypothetical protein
LFAQHPEQGRAAINIDSERFSINLEFDHLHPSLVNAYTEYASEIVSKSLRRGTG